MTGKAGLSEKDLPAASCQLRSAFVTSSSDNSDGACGFQG
jgi:hypothetical protein